MKSTSALVGSCRTCNSEMGVRLTSGRDSYIPRDPCYNWDGELAEVVSLPEGIREEQSLIPRHQVEVRKSSSMSDIGRYYEYFDHLRREFETQGKIFDWNDYHFVMGLPFSEHSNLHHLGYLRGSAENANRLEKIHVSTKPAISIKEQSRLSKGSHSGLSNNKMSFVSGPREKGIVNCFTYNKILESCNVKPKSEVRKMTPASESVDSITYTRANYRSEDPWAQVKFVEHSRNSGEPRLHSITKTEEDNLLHERDCGAFGDEIPACRRGTWNQSDWETKWFKKMYHETRKFVRKFRELRAKLSSVPRCKSCGMLLRPGDPECVQESDSTNGSNISASICTVCGSKSQFKTQGRKSEKSAKKFRRLKFTAFSSPIKCPHCGEAMSSESCFSADSSQERSSSSSSEAKRGKRVKKGYIASDKHRPRVILSNLPKKCPKCGTQLDPIVEVAKKSSVENTDLKILPVQPKTRSERASRKNCQKMQNCYQDCGSCGMPLEVAEPNFTSRDTYQESKVSFSSGSANNNGEADQLNEDITSRGATAHERIDAKDENVNAFPEVENRQLGQPQKYEDQDKRY